MRIPSRVYKSPDLGTRTDRVSKSDAKKTSGESGSSRAVASDVKVSVSEQARALASENAMDVEKVERLRSAIDSGELQMSFQLIADRIVQSGG